MRIGLLAEQAATTVATIRYYEDIGLLRPAIRQSGGQRTYDYEDVRRLSFIRRCRAFDFSIDDIRALLSLTQDRSASCANARDLAGLRLAEIRRKLRDLKALEASIAAMVSSCESECADGPGSDCVILSRLDS